MWLLLHGTPLTPEVWDGVRPDLERVYPVAAPTLPRPMGTGNVQAELAAKVIGGLDTKAKLHVVGHSFGGQVALEVALLAPHRIATLSVLCSRASPFPAFATTAASLRAGNRPDLDSSLHRWFVPDEVEAGGPVVDYTRRCIEQADHNMWADELDAIATYDRTAQLASINVPTTLIAAELDQVGTPEAMSTAAASMPHSTYQLVAGASHMSQFLHPDTLAARLLRFTAVATPPSRS